MSKKPRLDSRPAPKRMPQKPTSAPDGPSASPHPKELASKPAAQDVVLIHGVTEDKKGLKVLRARNDSVETGEVRPLTEGQSITSDVVRLKPRQGMPYLCDVETEISMDELKGSTQKDRTGPAQVASRAYRENWDTIWARDKSVPNPDPSKLN